MSWAGDERAVGALGAQCVRRAWRMRSAPCTQVAPGATGRAPRCADRCPWPARRAPVLWRARPTPVRRRRCAPASRGVLLHRRPPRRRHKRERRTSRLRHPSRNTAGMSTAADCAMTTRSDMPGRGSGTFGVRVLMAAPPSNSSIRGEAALPRRACRRRPQDSDSFFPESGQAAAPVLGSATGHSPYPLRILTRSEQC